MPHRDRSDRQGIARMSKGRPDGCIAWCKSGRRRRRGDRCRRRFHRSRQARHRRRRRGSAGGRESSVRRCRSRPRDSRCSRRGWRRRSPRRRPRPRGSGCPHSGPAGHTRDARRTHPGTRRPTNAPEGSGCWSDRRSCQWGTPRRDKGHRNIPGCRHPPCRSDPSGRSPERTDRSYGRSSRDRSSQARTPPRPSKGWLHRRRQSTSDPTRNPCPQCIRRVRHRRRFRPPRSRRSEASRRRSGGLPHQKERRPSA